MNIINVSKMPFVFHGAWDVLFEIHPSIAKTFLLVVLPFSLIPPAILLYVGEHHAPLFWLATGDSRWSAVAMIFFVAELFTVPAMAWLIKFIASQHQMRCEFKDCFLLAAIVAIPMWVSSVGLIAPSLWIISQIAVIGFLASAGLLYHGIYSFLKMHEPFEAQSLSYEILAAGLITWLMLCAFIILPLIE